MAVRPGYEKIGYGEYPLFHYLYAACLANGSVRGAMFVTYLTSDRGQRQVERAGFLPARQTSRRIVITRHPLGSSNEEDQSLCVVNSRNFPVVSTRCARGAAALVMLFLLRRVRGAEELSLRG